METSYATPKVIVPLQRDEPVITRRALLDVLQDRETNVTLYQNRPYTCVVLHSWYSGIEYTGFGFSKVCFPDKWDAEGGADRAHRRALIMILHQVREYEKSK